MVSCWESIGPDGLLHLLAFGKLARDPQVFSLEAGLIHAIGNAFSDQVLVFVRWIAVDVPIADLDSPRHGFGGIFAVQVPCPESE